MSQAGNTDSERLVWGRPMGGNERETTLYLIRHGESAWNLEGRVQGQQDVPLTDRGREQGRRAAARLARVKLTAVYASDLSRARETGELVAAPHKLSVAAREDLRERSFGVLEGKTLDETAGAPWLIRWEADRLRNTPPGGETQPEMAERVVAALEAIAAAHPGGRVAVATHGGPIKSMVYHLLRVPLALWNLTFVANGSITVLRGTGEVMRLVTLNDTCHLDAEPEASGPTVE